MGLGATADLLSDTIKNRKKAFYYHEYCELAEMVNRLHGMRRDIHSRFPGVSDAPEETSPATTDDPETVETPNSKGRRLVLKRHAPVSQPLPDLPSGVGLSDNGADARSIVHPENERPPDQH